MFVFRVDYLAGIVVHQQRGLRKDIGVLRQNRGALRTVGGGEGHGPQAHHQGYQQKNREKAFRFHVHLLKNYVIINKRPFQRDYGNRRKTPGFDRYI